MLIIFYFQEVVKYDYGLDLRSEVLKNRGLCSPRYLFLLEQVPMNKSSLDGLQIFFLSKFMIDLNREFISLLDITTKCQVTL